MTCHQAHERLSAYLDEVLSPEERAGLDAHLVSCPECARELAGLRQTVALLQRVQPVRAPGGFAERVLAAARPRPWHRRVADAVLLPLSAKLPLQATAAVMIGLLAVHLFERTPELQQTARQESPPSGVAGPVRERAAGPAEPLEDAAARVMPAPGTPAPPARAGGERDRRDMAGSQDAAPPVPAPPADPRPGPPAAVPAPELRPAPKAKAEVPRDNVGAAARSEAERSLAPEGGAAAVRVAPPPSPGLAAQEARPAADVVARVAVTDRDVAEDELAALVARVGGRMAHRRSEDEATVVEAVIPRPRYGEFSESLGRIGVWQIEAERPDLPALVRVILRLQ